MSSHHTLRFFLNHYEQQGAAIKRKVLKTKVRQLEREMRDIEWADFRHKRAVIKAAAEYTYWSEVGFYIITLITVLSIVLYGLRNI